MNNERNSRHESQGNQSTGSQPAKKSESLLAVLWQRLYAFPKKEAAPLPPTITWRPSNVSEPKESQKATSGDGSPPIEK